ncbi:BPTD_3080 family restriction endonuclease [Thioalkalivibrio sp. HK1]|uniref:BPTD_3080 family restriction endonuclease n=1 Tax=Thioalkalivibrio sp. HK1 TaxID=1469245 RepID=UPI00056DF64F|nr:DEAD/DEAH box helicase family protein [Thioalkalivibrio sp. HK1]
MLDNNRKLIINKPFDAPEGHWVFDEKSDRLILERDRRRPAGYYVSDPTAPAQQDRGRFIELELVNRIRGRVDAWREKGYPGIGGTTKKLLDHWRDEERAPRFFFCQLEAIETLIWLIETHEAEQSGIHIEGDGGPFRRLCSKLATGTGKTVVMAMLIAWQLCNKVANASDPRFAKRFLIVAPNLTVRRRLEVLDPRTQGNYYREFDILPRGWEDDLGNAQVVIHNWHALNWETGEAMARKVGVDKRGAMSDRAYVRRVLGGMSGTSKIVVINDEAHHAWRVPAGARPKGIEKAQVEEATKWVGGLDRIHRIRGISNCFDFSATPFAPSGKKTTEEALFPWIVSDFGLTDAIETGLVKTPRVVVRDDSKVDPAPFKSRLYHIYSSDDVKNDLKSGRPPHTPLPDLVNQAYMLLGEDWLEAKKAWKHGDTPPVMITVANSTETAARIKYAFEHGALAVDPALCDADSLLHIDSKVLKDAEERTVEEADVDAIDAPPDPKNRRQRAEAMRQRINTVGRVGEPGEKIQNVISVNMLSEGWDAKTVTHIMGLRAFTSQMLCEQVVGRGLRRASYDVNQDTGLYEPEYVNVFGVPFSFLPHEDDGASSSPPALKHWIEAIKSRRGEFGIEWPNVLRIEYIQRSRLEVDWDNTEPFDIDTLDTVTAAELAKTLGARLEDEGNLLGIDLKRVLADRLRLQTLTFKAAIEAYKEFGEKWQGGQGHLIGQLVLLAEEFMRSKKVRFIPEPDEPDRKRLFVALYMTRIVNFFIDAIRQSNIACRELVLDRKRPLCRTDDMLPWGTSRPSERTLKSHINRCVFDSAWEETEACYLDKSSLVQAWVKNDHLKFEIFYAYKGVVRRYRPDFLIRLHNGTMLVLEVKGVMRFADGAKHRAMGEWIDAVNEDGKYGRWAFAVSTDPADIKGILERHAAFESVAA